MVDLYLYTSYGRWLETIFIPLVSTVYPIWHASGHIIIKPYHVITWLRRFDLYNRHYCTRSFASRSNTLVHDCCGPHFTDRRYLMICMGLFKCKYLRSVNNFIIKTLHWIALFDFFYRTSPHFLLYFTAQAPHYLHFFAAQHRTI